MKYYAGEMTDFDKAYEEEVEKLYKRYERELAVKIEAECAERYGWTYFPDQFCYDEL